MKIQKETALTFDDLLLIPKRSTIKSRFGGEIDMSSEVVPGIKINIPIISSNMDTISGFDLVKAMNEFGATGIIHRFMDVQEHYKYLKELSKPIIGCIGVGEDGRKRMEVIADACDAVLIDIAHGHCDAMINQISWIRENFKNIPIIAGNVATYQGTMDLLEAGCRSVKVGVGCGALCTTRIKTGNGVPQATAIIECRKAKEDFYNKTKINSTLIADGGIRNSGDIIKCLALGASCIMAGNLLAGTEESPGKPIQLPGQGKMKIYRGQASLSAMLDWKGYATSVEGEISMVPYKGSIKEVMKDLVSGILSGMSYQNARTLNELYEDAEFVIQTNAGIIEAKPHGLLK